VSGYSPSALRTRSPVFLASHGKIRPFADHGGYRDAHRPRGPSGGGEAPITRCKAGGLAEAMIGERLNEAAIKSRDPQPRPPSNAS
jgi:hypothetical protein